MFPPNKFLNINHNSNFLLVYYHNFFWGECGFLSIVLLPFPKRSYTNSFKAKNNISMSRHVTSISRKQSVSGNEWRRPWWSSFDGGGFEFVCIAIFSNSLIIEPKKDTERAPQTNNRNPSDLKWTETNESTEANPQLFYD